MDSEERVQSISKGQHEEEGGEARSELRDTNTSSRPLSLSFPSLSADIE